MAPALLEVVEVVAVVRVVLAFRVVAFRQAYRRDRMVAA
jgi:hypothetical protein